MIPLQLPLRPALPNVYGPIDFRTQRNIYQRIDQILRQADFEMPLIRETLATLAKPATPKNINWLLSGFRCAIARKLCDLSLREFTVRLADSTFLQWFTYCGDYGSVLPCSKSSLKRFEAMFDLSELENSIDALNLGAAETNEAFRLGALNEAVDLGELFADCTCIKANIHFPVDWVMLIDCVRTLSLSMKKIREQDLKHRMPEPEYFITRMNSLAMAMSATRRKKDSKKKQKKTLRKMKKIVRTVEEHAKRYRELLNTEWEKTAWSRKQADQILKRMDNVLDQLPAAIHQAHERIIGERTVNNKDKILSLYDPDVHVNVRGKAKSEVEFGNKFYLCEQLDGLLVDWKLYREHVPNDKKLVKESIERMELCIGAPKGFVTDRGFPSNENVAYLKEKGIRDGMCPQDPTENQERRKDDWFTGAQKRRGGTEARIGIFKNVFLGGVLKEKGFESRNRALIWSVLAHNLWVLSRMSLADEEDRKEAAA
jgi:hypothetical protein